MLLKTYRNPITGENHICIFSSESCRKIGLGMREIQARCEAYGIRWEILQ